MSDNISLSEITIDPKQAEAGVTKLAKKLAHQQLAPKLETATSWFDTLLELAKSMGIGGLDSIEKFFAGLIKQANVAVAELKPTENDPAKTAASEAAAKAAAKAAANPHVTLAAAAPPAAPLGQRPPASADRAGPAG